MVTSLISVQSKKKSRRTPQQSTRKQKVLFRKTDEWLEGFSKIDGKYFQALIRIFWIFEKITFFQTSVVKMNITVTVTMVASQLVGCVMANQIACWVMMNKDVQLSCNHLQTDLKFILICRPMRIKQTLEQLLCQKKLLQIASWLVFQTSMARFDIFMARSYILFGQK